MSSSPCVHLTYRAGLLIKSEKDGLSLYNYSVELPKMFLEWSFSFNPTHHPHPKPSFARHNNKADGGKDKAGAAGTLCCFAEHSANVMSGQWRENSLGMCKAVSSNYYSNVWHSTEGIPTVGKYDNFGGGCSYLVEMLASIFRFEEVRRGATDRLCRRAVRRCLTQK